MAPIPVELISPLIFCYLNFIIGFLAFLMCSIACIMSNRYLFWLPTYFFIPFTELLHLLSYEVDETLLVASNLLLFIVVLMMFIASYKEYSSIFIRRKEKNKIQVKLFSFALISNPFLLGISWLMLVVQIVSTTMLARVYLRKKAIYIAFLFVSSLILCCKIFSDAIAIENIGQSVLSQYLMIAYSLMFFSTAMAVLLENTIDKSRVNLRKSNAYLNTVISSASVVGVNTADIANELSKNSHQINAKAEEIASTTIETMRKAENQTKMLEEISNMAEKIKNISKIVASISKQTNLIALNASIEAGRAGEHGLGFSIVAAKVQQLAEESRNSVEKTNSIVQSIVSLISRASLSSADVSKNMKEISGALQEQSRSIEQVSETATTIGKFAQKLKESLLIGKN